MLAVIVNAPGRLSGEARAFFHQNNRKEQVTFLTPFGPIYELFDAYGIEAERDTLSHIGTALTYSATQQCGMANFTPLRQWLRKFPRENVVIKNRAADPHEHAVLYDMDWNETYWLHHSFVSIDAILVLRPEGYGKPPAGMSGLDLVPRAVWDKPHDLMSSLQDFIRGEDEWDQDV